jgi:activator of 2-hydroxyglutaryl-CoA dehydratase
VRLLIARELGQPVFVPPDPQIVGAFGAALHAARQAEEKSRTGATGEMNA